MVQIPQVPNYELRATDKFAQQRKGHGVVRNPAETVIRTHLLTTLVAAVR